VVGEDKGKAVPRDTRFTRVWVSSKGAGGWLPTTTGYELRSKPKAGKRYSIILWIELQPFVHLALHISYPNAADRDRSRKLGASPEGGVEIHGLESNYAWVGSLHREINWTAGCVAVTNPEIEEIYKLVPVGTPVEIRADENRRPIASPLPIGENSHVQVSP